MQLYRHLLLQLGSFLVALLGNLLLTSLSLPLHWGGISLASALIALCASRIMRQPWWWQLIHSLFLPLVWLFQQFNIPTSAYFAGFFLLFLIFRSTASEQVPLYFSNHKTVDELARILPENLAVIDLGAGVGSLVFPLARARPDLQLFGTENAPLPWLLGWLRNKLAHRAGWYWGSFWHHSLTPYQVVYCFLSPAPMAALWEKARHEMQPGSIFISKAFCIPNVFIMAEIPCGAQAKDKLLIYQIPAHENTCILNETSPPRPSDCQHHRPQHPAGLLAETLRRTRTGISGTDPSI